MKKSAFSLPEVLIVLTILGVISAISLTVFNFSEIKNKVYEISYKKIYSDVDNYLSNALLDTTSAVGWSSDKNSLSHLTSSTSGESSTDALAKIITSAAKNTSTCTSADCFPNPKMANGDTISDAKYIRLTSGASLAVKYTDANCTGDTCGFIIIDVNGAKAPNLIDKDRFYLELTAKGVLPTTEADTASCCPDNSNYNFSTNVISTTKDYKCGKNIYSCTIKSCDEGYYLSKSGSSYSCVEAVPITDPTPDIELDTCAPAVTTATTVPIYNKADLRLMQSYAKVNLFCIKKPIYLGGEDSPWLPLSTDRNITIYGNGNTISGLYINSSTSDNQGLFGTFFGGTVNNLILSGVNIIGQANVGAFAGQITNATTLSNVKVTSTTLSTNPNITGTTNVSGLVGNAPDNKLTLNTAEVSYTNIKSSSNATSVYLLSNALAAKSNINITNTKGTCLVLTDANLRDGDVENVTAEGNIDANGDPCMGAVQATGTYGCNTYPDSKPTKIWRRADLEALTNGGVYCLAKDIDLSDRAWTPLNKSNITIYGGGNTIRGLYVSDPEYDAGLFHRLTGTNTFTNFNIENPYVSTTKTNFKAGALTGSSSGIINIENVNVTVTSGNSSTIMASGSSGAFAGGLLGSAGTVNFTCNTACTNSIALTTTTAQTLGGVIGLATTVNVNENAKIYTSGTLSGTDVGGLCGSADNINTTAGSVIEIGNTITATNRAGGIASNVSGSSTSLAGTVTIKNNISAGTIAGGLFGEAAPTAINTTTIKGKITVNSETANPEVYAGGLIGKPGKSMLQIKGTIKIEDEIKATTTGKSYVGGIFGNLNLTDPSNAKAEFNAATVEILGNLISQGSSEAYAAGIVPQYNIYNGLAFNNSSNVYIRSSKIQGTHVGGIINERIIVGLGGSYFDLSTNSSISFGDTHLTEFVGSSSSYILGSNMATASLSGNINIINTKGTCDFTDIIDFDTVYPPDHVIVTSCQNSEGKKCLMSEPYGCNRYPTGSTVPTAIRDRDGLESIANGGTYCLANSIDLSDEAWAPLEKSNITIYGGGYSITGLHASSTSDNVGLFKSLSGTNTFTHLNIIDPQIETTSDGYAGGLAAKLNSDATVNIEGIGITNATILANTETANNINAGRSGGLIGGLSRRAHININCNSSICVNDINLNNINGGMVGGLVGSIDSASTITVAENATINIYGNIKGASGTGGLFGWTSGLTFVNNGTINIKTADNSAVPDNITSICANSDRIESYAGGLTGHSYTTDDDPSSFTINGPITITKNISASGANSCKASCQMFAGGLFGRMANTTLSINDNVNINGKIEAKSSKSDGVTNAGGIIAAISATDSLPSNVDIKGRVYITSPIISSNKTYTGGFIAKFETNANGSMFNVKNGGNITLEGTELTGGTLLYISGYYPPTIDASSNVKIKNTIGTCNFSYTSASLPSRVCASGCKQSSGSTSFCSLSPTCSP